MRGKFAATPLGKIAHIEMGQSPDSSMVHEGEHGGVPFLQGNAEFGVAHPAPRFSCTAPLKMCRAGDVLLSVRAPVGAMNIADRDYCIGRGLAAVRVSGMSPTLAAHMVSAATPALRRVAQGTTFEAISKNDLASLLVMTPPPEDRQLLGNVLDTLDAAIRQTEAIIEKLKQVKQGLLHDLLTRGIDAKGELRPPLSQAPHLYKESPLGWIPVEWNCSSGQAVCREIVVGIVVKPTQYYRTSGIPVLRSANVRESGMTLSELVFMDPRDHKQQQKSAVRPGDVLTVRTGYPGTSCAVDGRVTEANCVDIIISRPDVDLDPRFWATWINSSFGKEQVLRVQGGLAQQHFNVSELLAMRVALPPVAEQREIMARINSLESRHSSEADYASALQALKAGLMDDLLTGRVRVTPLLEAAATT